MLISKTIKKVLDFVLAKDANEVSSHMAYQPKCPEGLKRFKKNGQDDNRVAH